MLKALALALCLVPSVWGRALAVPPPIGLSAAGTGSGSVTSESVATANGFAGTVANPSTTPVITLTVTASGLIKASGGAITGATAGVDYVVPSALTAYLLATGNGSGLTGLTWSQIGSPPTTFTGYGLTVPAGMLKGSGGAPVAATAGVDYVAPSALTAYLLATGNGSGLTGLTWSQIGSPPTTFTGYGLTVPAGMLKGSGGAPVAATAGVDYVAPSALTAYLLATGNGSGLTGLTWSQISGAPGAATSSTLGLVKPDGTTITNASGALSVTYGTTAGTAAQGNDSRITGALSAATAAGTYAPIVNPMFSGTSQLGAYTATRSRIGVSCISSTGDFSTPGDSQVCTQVLRGTSTSTSVTRLTADGAAAGSTNCINLPNNTLYVLAIDVGGTDETAPGNAVSAPGARISMFRGATVAATSVTVSYAGGNGGFGSGTSFAAPTFTADITNGCLNLSVTPLNSDTWHYSAKVVSTEVQ